MFIKKFTIRMGGNSANFVRSRTYIPPAIDQSKIAETVRAKGRRTAVKNHNFEKPLRLNWLNKYSTPPFPNSSLTTMSAAIAGETPPTITKTKTSSEGNIPYEAKTQGV